MSDQQEPVQQPNNSPKTLSKQEADLIDETFNIMKNLNQNIEKVEGQKKKLQEDIQSLSRKIAKSPEPKPQVTEQHEKKVQDYVNQNLILHVKKEIVQEFEPLLERLKAKSLSVNLDQDLTKVLDKELLKIKKEFDNERARDKRSYTKKFTTIEERLVDAIKGNEKLQKSFKKYEDKIEGNVGKLFEKRLSDALDKTSKKFVSLYNASAKEIDTVKELVKINRIEMNDNIKILKQFKKDIESKMKEDSTEFSSFDAKINELVKQNESLHNYIQSFENELHTRKDKELKLIETQFEKASTVLNEKLEELDNKAQGQEELILKQVNQMVDKINTLDKKSSDRLQKQGEKLQETLSKITDRNRTEMSKVKEQSILLTKKEREKVVEKFSSFKDEIRKKVESDVGTLSKRLAELDKFEQEKDQLIAERIDQLTEAHGKDVDDIMSGLKVIKDELHTTIKNVHKQVIEDYKETEHKLLDKFHNELSESRAKILEHSTKQAEENADQIVQLASELRSQLDQTIEEKASPFESIRDELQRYIKEHQEAFELKEKLLASFKEELDESRQDLEDKFERVEAQAIRRVDSLSDDFEDLSHNTVKALENFDETFSKKFVVQAEENADQIVNLATELRSQLSHAEDEYHKSIDTKIEDLEKLHGEISTVKKDFETEFSEHQTEVNNTLEHIRERNLSILETKFTEVDSNVANLSDHVEERLSKLQDTHDEIVELRSHIDEQFSSQAAQIEETISNISETIYTELETDKSKLVEEVEEKLHELQAAQTQILAARDSLDTQFFQQAEENADQIVQLATQLRTELDSSEEKSIELINQKTEALLGVRDQLQSYVEEKVAFVESLKGEFDVLTQQVNGYGKSLEEQEELLVGKVNDIIELQEKSLEGLYAIVEKSQVDLDKQFNKLESNLKAEIEKKINKDVKQVEKLRDQLQHQYKEEVKELDEKLARQIIKGNEFMTKLEAEDKSHRRTLTEDVQKQFLDVKNHFEKEYTEQVNRFNEELRRKEQEYLEKILLLEQDKQKTVADFEDKFSQITIAKKDFTQDKETFEKEVTKEIQELKKDLDVYAKDIEHKLRGIVSKERDIFERHESSFREVFGQKVGGLQEYLKERLDRVEKKFLEKNHKLFQDTIKEHVKSLETTKETALSAIQTLDEKDRIHEAQTKEFYDNLSATRKELEEHLDIMFKDSNKAISKRLLEFDADFAQFKGVIVEEVNGIMKDMKQALASSGKKQQLGKGYKTEIQAVEGELVSLRREHTELKSRVNNIASFNPSEGMNSVVGGLVDYENNLISLVESLKRRGVSDETIKEALANKGHPRLYVSMILQTL